MSAINIKKVDQQLEGYLRDESRLSGQAETISFPQTTSDIIQIIKKMDSAKIPITVQGARTGISGGASPAGGHILNLSKMNKITGLEYDSRKKNYFLTLQPGVLLTDIRKKLNNYDFNTKNWTPESKANLEKLKSNKSYFFPPDPTEKTASIGGMIACNASGACSFYYGSTRKYIEELQIILADGSKLNLKRGREKATEDTFEIKTKKAKKIKGRLPDYRLPRVKNTAGLYVRKNMDLIDLFIGCEGTLGIISKIKIRLIPEPDHKWGILSFFKKETEAVNFVKKLRENNKTKKEKTNRLATTPVAIEYLNHKALQILQGQNMISVPRFPSSSKTVIYTEFHTDNKNKLKKLLSQIANLLTTIGGNAANTWVARNHQEYEHLNDFRHSVPEAVNNIIDERKKKHPRLTKLGTDMAVPDSKLNKVLAMYNHSLQKEKLQSVMFGHIGDNHIHVNILPRTMQEYSRGKELYKKWAQEVIKMGGTISAEHGIGKLKKDLHKKMFGLEAIEKMKALKKIFDPQNKLNPKNLL